MGIIEDQSKWFFKKTLFLWLPIAAIVLLIQKWRAGKNKEEQEE